jgi:hypothetical protein
MVTEVFSRIGEGESFSQNSRFHNKVPENGDYDPDNDNEDNISVTKPMSKVKKEFFDSMNKESLTIDTCNKLNHDWKKKD